MTKLPIVWNIHVCNSMNTTMLEGIINSNLENTERLLISGALEIINMSKRFSGNVFYNEGAYTGKAYNSSNHILFYLKFDNAKDMDTFVKSFIKEQKSST